MSLGFIFYDAMRLFKFDFHVQIPFLATAQASSLMLVRNSGNRLRSEEVPNAITDRLVRQ